ncbi:hypothetical protein HDE_12501 [Halotydeus destructor]|nr:hypothetical protein HDE_12501 [Halotydeus destructor]
MSDKEKDSPTGKDGAQETAKPMAESAGKDGAEEKAKPMVEPAGGTNIPPKGTGFDKFAGTGEKKPPSLSDSLDVEERERRHLKPCMLDHSCHKHFQSAKDSDTLKDGPVDYHPDQLDNDKTKMADKKPDEKKPEEKK